MQQRKNPNDILVPETTLEEMWGIHLYNDLPVHDPNWHSIATFNAKNSFYTGAASFAAALGLVATVQDPTERQRLTQNLYDSIEEGLLQLEKERETVEGEAQCSKP